MRVYHEIEENYKNLIVINVKLYAIQPSENKKWINQRN